MARESKQASAAALLWEDSASLPAFVVPRLLRIHDAAKYLSATTWQVETLLRDNTIPSFVLGKRRVVDRLELDRYVERRNAEAKATAEKASSTPETLDQALSKCGPVVDDRKTEEALGFATENLMRGRGRNINPQRPY